MPISDHNDYYRSTYLEFLAVLKATKQVKLRTCEEIMIVGYSILDSYKRQKLPFIKIIPTRPSVAI